MPQPRGTAGPPDPDTGLEAPAYRPIGRRRRLLIALLAIATAVTVVSLLLRRPSGTLWPPPPPTAPAPEQPPCAPGQTERCVGGTAPVFVVPAPSPASR